MARGRGRRTWYKGPAEGYVPPGPLPRVYGSPNGERRRMGPNDHVRDYSDQRVAEGLAALAPHSSNPAVVAFLQAAHAREMDRRRRRRAAYEQEFRQSHRRWVD